MGRVVVCFPGQGSQKNLMGFDLYQKNDAYKKMIDQSFEVLPELKDIIFSADNPLINDTRYSQLAIFSNQVAIYNLIKDKVESPAFCGFSLGEYSAFACAGLYDYKTGLEIVNKRAIAMSSLEDSGVMYAVIGVLKAELINIIESINSELGTNIELANSNTEKQQVLAGLESDFEKAMEMLKASSIRKIIKLKVSGAFHTSRFNDVGNAFCESIKAVSLNPLQNDVYSNVTAKVIKDADMLDYFAKHMVTGVDFYQEVVNMIADGYDTFIEIGEVSVLSSMIKSVNREVNLIHVATLEDIEKLEVL